MSTPIHELLPTLGSRAPFAYLDPGSGSFILQLLVAGILGGLVALRMSWAKIKARFTRKSQGSEGGEPPPEDKPGA
jgi:hypothetical protein